MSLVFAKPLERDKDFDDFCRIPLGLSKITGYDFADVRRPQWMRYLMRIYMMSAVLSHFYCFYFISKETFLMLRGDINDLPLLMRLISGVSYAFFATAKFSLLAWNVKDLKKIYDNLADIYPKTAMERRMHRVNEYFWPKWIQIILYLYFGVVTFISVSALGESIISYVIDLQRKGFEETTFGYLKLYEILYSFDHRHPFTYLLAYSIEMMHAQFVIIFNVLADVLLLCYVLQLCMHFDYVAKMLDEYEPDAGDAMKDNQFLAQVVKKHYIMLDLCGRVNEAFGGLLLLLLMGIASTICCAAVYTFTQGIGRELLAYVAFLPTVIGQYYLVCYYGQQLMETSQRVSDAAYNHPWYRGSQSYKKSILIIMIRSQREVQLNAKGYNQPICLEAFKMVMNSTYRLFAVLKQTMLE